MRDMRWITSYHGPGQRQQKKRRVPLFGSGSLRIDLIPLLVMKNDRLDGA